MNEPEKFVISDVCTKFGIEKEFLVHCIRTHLIRPASPESLELDQEDVARLRLIRELEVDFGVNEEAIPIILHLIDQIHFIRRRMSI